MKHSILVFPLGVLQKLNTQQKTVQIALHMYNIKVFSCPLITIISFKLACTSKKHFNPHYIV